MSKKHHKQLKRQSPTEQKAAATWQNKESTAGPGYDKNHPASHRSLNKILIVAVLLLVIILAEPSVRDYLFKSSKDKMYEQSHRIGLTIPKEVQARQTVIQLKLGKLNSQDVSIAQLRQGMYVNSKLSSECSNDPYKIYLRLEEQKLFLTAEIKSLEGKIIGDIRENKWVLKDEKIVDYHGDGTTYFEVLDNNKRIPFSIVCNGSEILLSGIFVDKECFVILNDDALVTRDMNEAAARASVVKPFMPFDSLDEN